MTTPPKYDSTESSAVADAVDLNVSSAVGVQERRIAWDGKAYTNEDFQQWYGAAGGNLWGLAWVKADPLLLSALHMTVLGQDPFISKIICLLGTHPDPWTPEKHWGRCGQSCACCRAYNEEDWPSGCFICNQMWDLTTFNRLWRDRTCKFDGRVFTGSQDTGCV